MIREQELHHTALGFFDFLTLRGDYHAIGAANRAGCLELWHFVDAHETHATGSLQRQVGVVAKRGNFESVFAADIDQAGTLGHLQIFVIDGDFD